MLVQPDGKLVVVGRFNQINGLTRYGAARLLPSGQVDTTFVLGSGTDTDLSSGGEFFAVARQSDGKILAAGNFRTAALIRRAGLGRFLANGQLDPAFRFFEYDHFGLPEGEIGLQPDGKILLAGPLRQTIGSSASGITRLLGDSAQSPPPPSVSPLRIALDRSADGNLHLVVQGAIGRKVGVYSSDDLVRWIRVAEITAPGEAPAIPSSVFSFVPQQFFKIQMLPE
ncbi:MAG: delta-60 repeat domain-containing protein [Acidobacteria bacterium]|nr:delta-60 repeat domain-containing protein [Acidobacteriota bacterium]